MDGEGGVGAALGEAEHRIPGDLVHETDAAGAHDAALVIEPDARADIDVLRLFHLHVHEAGDSAAEADGLLLEAALAGLVADRAVERVVDEEKFHDALAAFLDEIAGGADAHVLRDGVGAGNGGAGHPADGFVAVFVAGRLLAGCGAGRHSHLDEAHAAVARHRQFRMVAVVRHVHFRLAAGLDHAGSLWKLVPDTVDLDIHHAFFGGYVLGKFGFSGGRWGVAHDWKRYADTVPERLGGLCRGKSGAASVLCEKFHKVRAGEVFAGIPVGMAVWRVPASRKPQPG